MHLHRALDVRRFLGEAPHEPCFVALRIDAAGKLHGIGVSFGSALTTAYVTGEEALVTLLPGLLARPLLTFDAALLAERFELFASVMPTVHADIVTANNLLRPRLPTLAFVPHLDVNQFSTATAEEVAESYRTSLPEQHVMALGLFDSLLTYGLRVAYAVELHATMVVARYAARGYRVAGSDTRVFPSWKTQHESGSGSITASGPALTSLPATERLKFIADEGHRWVQIEWPFFDIEVLAARSQDPWLLDLSREDNPYQGLAELFTTDVADARSIFARILTTGPDLQAAAKRGVAEAHLRALMACCPDWVHWAAAQRTQAEADGVLQVMGRMVRIDEPRKAHGLVLQMAQSMLLKMLITRLQVTAEQYPDAFAGLRTLIPCYSKLAYQIDAHVPLAFHLPRALDCGKLMPCPGVILRPQVSMGPSWGQLTVATSSRLSQAEQDLLTPATYHIQCPDCQMVASDEATLRQHAADVHGYNPHVVGEVEAFIAKARSYVAEEM